MRPAEVFTPRKGNEYAEGEPELHPVITMWAIDPAESDEEAAELFEAVAQEHGHVMGRLS